MRTFFALIIGLLFLSVCSAVNTKDWLRNAYQGSHETMADPYSSDLEAEDLFDTTNTIDINKGNISLVQKDSVFVRFARFLLRLAVILAIPMIIFAAVKVILSSGDEGKMRDALKQIGFVVLGILLALASVMIIFLITALSRSSLNFFS